MEFWEGSSFEERFEEAQRSKDYLAKGVIAKKWDPLGILDVRVGRDDTPEQAAPAYESAVEEMRKDRKVVYGYAILGKKKGYISHLLEDDVLFEDFEVDDVLFEDFEVKGSGGLFSSIILPTILEAPEPILKGRTACMKGEPWPFVGGKRPGDTCTAESTKQIPSESFYGGIQNSFSNFFWELKVDLGLLHDLEAQPLLAKTYAILFPNLINANFSDCKRWKGVFSATFRTLRNALKKVWSKQSRGPNIVSNGLSLFKSASNLAVGMVLIGNTPAVGAVRAMAPEPGSSQAEDFEKWSNFWFGVVNCIGVLAAIITLLKSFNWRRRHSIAGTSAASAPAGAILNRAVNMAQTHTVLRSWRETEFREVVVACHEEIGAYAS